MILKYKRLFIAILLLVLIFLGVCLRVLAFPWKKDHVLWLSRNLAWVGINIFKLQINYSHRSYHFVDGVKIIVSNHQNNFDMFPGGFSIPPRTVTLGKRDLIWIPFFGLAYLMTGNILINRDNKKDAWKALDEVQSKLLAEKKSLWMLPEGTRSRGRGLLPFKKGAFVLAIRAGLPIVPVCFSSYHGKIDLSQSPSGRILISVLKPIETTRVSIDEEEQFRQMVWKMMKAEIDRLDQELLTT
jgi:1-acyl-sn-glycerol-3-phosphate acyltransferase